MQTMKQLLTSFVGKPLDATFDDGVIRLNQKSGPIASSFPRYEIKAVGTDMFEMVYRGSDKTSGAPTYYRIDKVLSLKPTTS